ncbi:glutathione S-transferase family protein [Alphaproteobacteria bacterium]|nr:glutathione S-transferase family protein [Alphaproteobacteria bacterium]
MLVLYDVAISSYGCKTRILLRHKGLEWTSLAPPDGYGSPAYCKIVPSGTIPALVHDGFTLGESDAIAEYVNELAPEPAMLPEPIEERAMARALSRFHDTRIEPLLRAYFGQVAPTNRNVDFIVENAALLERRFHQLAKIRTPSPLLTGADLSLADCGFAPSFAIIDCLQGLLGFDLTLPASIKAYQAVLCAHPSVRDEYAAYVNALGEWVAAKIAG